MLLGLWCAGLLFAMLWLYTSRPAAWAILLVAAAVLLGGLGARYGWKNSPVGQLAWDGQLWRWESPVYQTGIAEQQLFVIADFQHLLLLRIENRAHASLWLWAERRALPDRWLDLRRAVYSRQRTGSVHSQTPAARGDQARPTAAVP
jgi:toxin CptA